MNIKYLRLGFAALISVALGLQTELVKAQTTVTFTSTGALQTFTTPQCAGTMTIVVRGAQGGTGGTNGPAGALGGAVRGVLTAVPGQVLNIYVGGQGSVTTGGFNGGGNGGVSSSSSGAGGGGASDIRIGGVALSNRVIVAAGGGGGGGNSSYTPIAGIGGGGTAFTSSTGVGGAGAGGCATGSAGGESGGAAASYGSGGGGGGLSSGGSGGGSPSSSTGGYGCPGVLGGGGNGGSSASTICGGATGGINGGGGGGGGYYGGGGGMTGTGGCNGGGGGGSSWISTPLFSSPGFTGGVNSGAGLVTITYDLNGTALTPASTATAVCVGSTVNLSASGVVTYTWFPNGTFAGSNASLVTVSPSVTTSYSVQGTNSFGCLSSALITVSIDPGLPVLTLTNTASAFGGICPNATMALTAGGATTYTWTSPVVNGVSFGPTVPSTYVVTGQNACGTASTAVSISVHPLPAVSAVASQPTICSGNPVMISGVGDAATYSVVNIGIPHASNFFPSTTGNYTVVGTSALGCTNSAVQGITVVTTPANIPIATPPLICIGNSATLSSSGATSYTWTTPGGPQTNSIITVSPTSSSTYTLTKSNANCVNIQTVQVVVNLLPAVFAISTPTLICASRTATLQGGGAVTYTWTAPNFTTTGTAPVVSPSISTMYTVTASDGTCVNTTTVNLATNPNPTINIVATSTNICQGDNVSLTANGAIGYSWTSVGVTSNTNAASITESPTVATLYQITGINNFNCTSNQSQIVLVRTTPTITIATTKPLVCKGAPSTLTANSTGGQCTYVWDANAGSVTTSVAIVNPIVNTTYSVIGLAANGCTATQNYPVSVFLPTFAVNSPTSSCLGGTINLFASGAASYTWTGGIPFGTIPVSPPAATIYVVSATSNSIGVNCVSSNTVVVSIYQNPTVTATPSRTQICRGEVTNVNALGATTYTWNTLQTGSVVPVNPQNNTTYTVTGTDQNGCIGTATVQVKTSVCFGIDELNKQNQVGLSIYPNPNTGMFNVKSDVDMQLDLLNELGQVVRSLDLNTENSHKTEISGLSKGIYFLVGNSDGNVLMEKIVVY